MIRPNLLINLILRQQKGGVSKVCPDRMKFRGFSIMSCWKKEMLSQILLIWKNHHHSLYYYSRPNRYLDAK